MAKKHKRHKRRRIAGSGGGFGKKGMAMKLLAVGAGYLLADKINEQVDKMLPKGKNADGTAMATPSENTLTVAMVGKLGLGALLLSRKPKPGTVGMVTTIGGGILAGAGLKQALKKAGVISGFQSVPVLGRMPRIAGYQDTPVIGRMPSQLSGGTPAALQGYKVNGYVPHGSGVGVLAGRDGGSGSGIMQNSVSGLMG